MTRSQLADSAKAPWTRTIVGAMEWTPLGWKRDTPEPSRFRRFVAPGYPRGQGPRVLSRRDRRRLVGERVVELAARADAELGEHVLQVPLDGARADVQLRPDLGVRAPVARQTGDLRLLRGELVAGLHRA